MSENTNETYAPKLEFYHPSMKGNGSAVRWSLNPAAGDDDGCLFLSIAAQNGTGAAPTADQPRRFASFDWQNKVTAKINFSEVCDILLLLSGRANVLAHAGKNGLYHTTASATTVIEMKRGEDSDRPSFQMLITKTLKADGSRKSIAFYFSLSEALGLRLALEQSMGLLAFGIPRPRRDAATLPVSTGAPNVYGLSAYAPHRAPSATPAEEELADVPGGF